jgi:hypothetical protein
MVRPPACLAGGNAAVIWKAPLLTVLNLGKRNFRSSFAEPIPGTCSDNDLLKGSDHLIRPLSRTGRGALLGTFGVYAANFSWKKSRIAAHERLSVFSL